MDDTTPEHDVRQDPPLSRKLQISVSLVVWVVLVAIGAPLLMGGSRIRLGPETLLPVAVGIVGSLVHVRVLPRLRWRRALGVAFAIAVLWSVSLALTDGRDGLTAHNELPGDYLTFSRDLTDPLDLLKNFTESMEGRYGHVTTHPPGFVLLLWILARIGLGGDLPVAALMIAGGCSALVAALACLRLLAGEDKARAALPFVVLSPAAIWIATSADAFFAGVGAAGVVCFAVAATRTGRARDGWALLSGATFGIALFMSYGLALLGLVPVAIALHRRTVRPLLVAAVAALGMMAIFGMVGFSWVDAFSQARMRHLSGVAGRRDVVLFMFANLGAMGVALSPAGWLGGWVLRDKRVWVLVAGALGAVLIADVTGMSRGEVERIWLPFYPWLLLAACALGNIIAPQRALAVHVSAGIIVQVLLHSPW